MPLHLMLVAKIHSFSATPMLATLIWPFCMKVMLSLRPIKDIVRSIAYDSNVLVFQLTHIITSHEDRGRRWHRVARVVHQRMLTTTRSTIALATQTDEDSLHTLTMVAL
ncbi:hypothetical protein L6452_25804 [Arctium lappa]|uniref:Uncharacterized protein n=1 Tax=Arctium lappa TaxID=4217 RepID=A0ACB9ABI9_ARCLA|nr:hypothetical protein L6452_25804 [Arctium lappa]